MVVGRKLKVEGDNKEGAGRCGDGGLDMWVAVNKVVVREWC